MRRAASHIEARDRKNILASIPFCVRHGEIAGVKVRVTVCGICSFIVGMSISRFAYTPILPVLLQQHAVSHAEGALLASGNLLGYLLGAFPAGAARLRAYPVQTLRIALAVNVLTLLIMCVPHAHALWAFARVLSGISSAFIFVFASTLVLALQNARASAALFSSVGAGIALSGLFIPAAYGLWHVWSAGWLLCTALAAALAAVAAACAAQPAMHEAHTPRGRRERRAATARVVSTTVAYGIAGFSYIVPATFLVALLDAQPPLRAYAWISWPIVGILAALSIPLWSPLAERFGKSRMLVCALLLLALGCAGPLISRSLSGALVGAVGLGGSFMAISMLSVGIVRDLDPSNASTRIAHATTVFGIGQVLGPLATALAYAHTGSYSSALAIAALALIAAAAAVLPWAR